MKLVRKWSESQTQRLICDTHALTQFRSVSGTLGMRRWPVCCDTLWEVASGTDDPSCPIYD